MKQRKILLLFLILFFVNTLHAQETVISIKKIILTDNCEKLEITFNIEGKDTITIDKVQLSIGGKLINPQLKGNLGKCFYDGNQKKIVCDIKQVNIPTDGIIVEVTMNYTLGSLIKESRFISDPLKCVLKKINAGSGSYKKPHNFKNKPFVFSNKKWKSTRRPYYHVKKETWIPWLYIAAGASAATGVYAHLKANSIYEKYPTSSQTDEAEEFHSEVKRYDTFRNIAFGAAGAFSLAGIVIYDNHSKNKKRRHPMAFSYIPVTDGAAVGLTVSF